MARLAVSLFGGFEVRLDGAPVTGFEYEKVRALLAYIVLEPPFLRDRDALAGLLWPEQRGEDARQNLRQALYRLRAALADDAAAEPLILTTRTGVQRNPAADLYCDALAFDEHLAAHPESLASLAQAAVLYHGELLHGLALAGTVDFEDWLLLKREHYARQALDVVDRLARHRAGLGDYHEALAYAQRELELAPWREEAHQLTMDLLARTGRRSAALRQYELCRRALQQEIGVEPDLETRRLYLKIKAPIHHRLPAQATPFVGRAEELAHVGKLLANSTCRLITISGLGGMGKTRLAVAAAARAIDEDSGRFLHGVAFVPLAGIDHVREVVPAIARSVDFTFSGAEPEQAQLLNYLRERELLLVLDNFEQLIGTQARSLLQAIISAASGIKMLVTSRERLDMAGEHLLLLAGLPVLAQVPADPGAAIGEQHPGDAVRLFLDAARRAGAPFTATAEDLAAAVRICILLGGMPLAIELAAGWSTTLSPGDIAGELEGCLDLVSEDRSLLAVFDATWGRLNERLRFVLGTLSVCRDGFSRDAAQAIAQASPRDLLALVERSLLRRGDDGRFVLHELLRQYVLKRLEAEPAALLGARDRHAAYCADFLARRQARLRGGDTMATADEIHVEIENLRAAWLWAAERGRSDWIEQAVVPLHLYHELRSEFEAVESLWVAAEAHLKHWLTGAPGSNLAGSGRVALQEALAQVLAMHAATALRWTEPKWVRQLAEKSLELREPLAGPSYGAALALIVLGTLARQDGQLEEAGERYQEAAAIAQSIEDAPLIALMPELLGLVALSKGDRLRAKQLLLEALRLGQKIRNPWHEAYALQSLAELADYEGDGKEALRLARECDRVATAIGSRHVRTGALMIAARGHRKLGALVEARQALAKGLGLAISDADRLMLLGQLSGLLHDEGLREQALELNAFVLAHPILRPEDRPRSEQVAAGLSAKAGSEEWVAAETGAASRRLEDFVALYAE